MIRSGEKKEEYREKKPYWTNRLYYKDGNPIKYDAIQLTNGYDDNSPSIIVEYLGVEMGTPKPGWCPQESEREHLYKIKLGEVLFEQNIPENELSSKAIGITKAGY